MAGGFRLGAALNWPSWGLWNWGEDIVDMGYRWGFIINMGFVELNGLYQLGNTRMRG